MRPGLRPSFRSPSPLLPGVAPIEPREKPAAEASLRCLQDEVLDRLYEVVEDPTAFDAALDGWNALMAPLQQAAGGQGPIPLTGPDFGLHFGRISRLLSSAGRARRQRPDVAAVTAVQASAAFVVDAALRVTAINAATEQQCTVRVGQSLRDFSLAPEDATALAAELRALFDGRQRRSATLRVRNPRHGAYTLLSLRPVMQDPDAGCERPDYVLVITSVMNWPVSHGLQLQETCGLTPAEYEVLRALSSGHSVSEIAEARGRSIQTVRAQIKSLQQKTETRSQQELVSFGLATVATAPRDEETEASPSSPPVSRGYHRLTDRPFRRLMRPGGRWIDYLTLGDPDGMPCLYLPGVFTLCRWPAAAEKAAADRGLRVIVPLRAGYGSSAPIPPSADRRSVVVADYLAVIDHLGLQGAPVLTQDHDLYFAAQLHAARPGVFGRVLALAATLPLTHAAQYARMARWQRFVLSAARFTPALLPDMVRAAFSMSRYVGKAQAFRLFYGRSAPDMAAFASDEVKEAVMVGSEATMSRDAAAAEAFIEDTLLVHGRDWTAEARALFRDVPSRAWIGAQDNAIGGETAREQIAAFPEARISIVEDAGQLLFMTSWPAILNDLTSEVPLQTA